MAMEVSGERLLQAEDGACEKGLRRNVLGTLQDMAGGRAWEHEG